MTERIELAATPVDAAAARAAAVLEAGGIVAFPTETVYGLGVRGDDPEAVRRLYELKGRGENKPLARYVSGLEQADALAPDLPAPARRLMRALWPGPVTVVTDVAGASVGLRCAAEPVVLALAGRARVPVLGTSANRSGEPELGSADEILAAFPQGVDLVLDGGPRRDRAASTVVAVAADGAWKILREGEVPRAVIEDELATRWLFVCSGNTCRSPMAAALARRLGAERGIRTYSAGLFARAGQPATEAARQVMRERGLDLDDHRSRPLEPELVERMDRVFVMTRAHLLGVLDLEVEIPRGVTLLGRDREVSDPFGGPVEVYRACAAEIEEHLGRWLAAERPSDRAE